MCYTVPLDRRSQAAKQALRRSGRVSVGADAQHAKGPGHGTEAAGRPGLKADLPVHATHKFRPACAREAPRAAVDDTVSKCGIRLWEWIPSLDAVGMDTFA